MNRWPCEDLYILRAVYLQYIYKFTARLVLPLLEISTIRLSFLKILNKTKVVCSFSGKAGPEGSHRAAIYRL